MKKDKLLELLKTSNIEDFDESKIDIYYNNYKEFEPAINSIRAIGGILAVKSNELQLQWSKYCGIDELPSLAVVDLQNNEHTVTPENIRLNTADFVNRLTILTATRSLPEDKIHGAFNSVAKTLETIQKYIEQITSDIIEEFGIPHGKTPTNVITLIEEFHIPRDGTPMDTIILRNDKLGTCARMDLSGLTTEDDQDLVGDIVRKLLNANPEIDVVECLNMAKEYLHETYDIDAEVTEVEDE